MTLNRFQNFIHLLLLPRPHGPLRETEPQVLRIRIPVNIHTQFPCQTINSPTTRLKRLIKRLQVRQLLLFRFVKNHLQILEVCFQSADDVDDRLDIRFSIFCGSVILDAGGHDLLRDLYYGDYTCCHGKSGEGFGHGGRTSAMVFLAEASTWTKLNTIYKRNDMQACVI